MDDLFKGRRFEREIIVLWVRWYLRQKLSLRDLAEIMAERGLTLAHTTMRAVQTVGPGASVSETNSPCWVPLFKPTPPVSTARRHL